MENLIRSYSERGMDGESCHLRGAFLCSPLKRMNMNKISSNKNGNIKKTVLQYMGVLFIIIGIISWSIHSFIVTSSNEPFPRDLLGFAIPQPPIWTSYIPYLGRFIGFLFESFSIHGLIGIFIFLIPAYIGGGLLNLSDKKHERENKKEEKQASLWSMTSNLNIPDVIKQEITGKKKEMMFLGVKMTEKNFPILLERAKNHPEKLKSDLENLVRVAGGTIQQSMINLESDLQHG